METILSITSIISFLVISIGSVAAPIPAHAADWQTTLEQAFPGAIVETFDNLQDWNPTFGHIAEPQYQPKRLDGTACHFTWYDAQNLDPNYIGNRLPGEDSIKAISNHGEYSLGAQGVQGNGKSLTMSFANFATSPGSFPAAFDRSALYGPVRMSIFLGTVGDWTSGWPEIYVFMRVKFPWKTGSLTGAGHTWVQSAHGTEEYYLSGGTEHYFFPNAVTINGTRRESVSRQPFTLSGTSASDNGDGTVSLAAYPLWGSGCYLNAGDVVVIEGTTNYNGTYMIQSTTGDDYHHVLHITHSYVAESFGPSARIGIKLGSLGTDSWSYGNNDSLGYPTLYVRLSGSTSSDRNPNYKTSGYITEEIGFWTQMRYGDNIDWGGAWKTLCVSGGFYDVSNWHTADGSPACEDRQAHNYGLNMQLYELGSSSFSSNSGIAFFLETFPGTWYAPGNCYGYLEDITNGQASSRGVNDYATNGQWMSIEIRQKAGTIDTANGEVETWFYSPDGTVIDHHLYTGLTNMRVFQEKWNRVEIGGNRINNGYWYSVQNSWDNRWYVDDLILNQARIGPTYFGLAKGQTPPAPIPPKAPGGLRIR